MHQHEYIYLAKPTQSEVPISAVKETAVKKRSTQLLYEKMRLQWIATEFEELLHIMTADMQLTTRQLIIRSISIVFYRLRASISYRS